MKAQAYRDMTVDELQARAGELRKELLQLRIQAETKELDNVATIRESKRELARVLTVAGEKSQA